MMTPEQYLAENNLAPTDDKLKTFLSFVREAQREGAADECASCQKILEGVANVLHNQLKDRSAEQAIGAVALYGAVGDQEMRAAAKVLRSVATSLRVREIKIREGKL
jgi:hypothetical protein